MSTDAVQPTHRPGPGRVTPTSTYRLQVHEGFDFEAAAAQVPYLHDLGVSHLYLSPVLQSAPGSTHGYDVLDHTRLSSGAGGRDGFDRLVAECRRLGLGIIVDIVPNHMTVPRPTHLNAPFWSLLREGRRSPYAAWFDVDWAAEDDRILMPVLGGTVEQAIAAGDLVLAQDGGATGREWVLWHHGDEFPVRPGTERMPLADLVEAQAYRLSSWREAGEALNYRRFFDVTSLVAVRVEDPMVFMATHALLLALFGHGAVDGFRIDHPDGLADPAGYLARLADATGDAWVVVEKILEGDERLADEWRCAGTTGYDALLRVQQVLTDGSGAARLTRLWDERAPEFTDLDRVITDAKRLVVDDVQAAEVDRLMRLVRRVLPTERGGIREGDGRQPDDRALRRGLEALLIAMDRYRAYFVPGELADPAEYAVIDAAEQRARDLLDPADHEALATIAQLVRGARVPEAQPGSREAENEFRVRFQQTCGPVMAKGIEDTAFYRWLRLAGANEVGGHPGQLGLDPAGFHAFAVEQLADWPTAMTTLTTHDTKRSEDVRARLMTLAEDAVGWAAWLGYAEELATPHRTPLVDRPTEYLIWQTLIGTWPMTAARLEVYLLKAVREAKVHTAWVDGDPAYEEAVVAFARALLQDLAVREHIEAWLTDHAPAVRANVLGQKLIQLTMPGVPDVYQGAELTITTLVDPDNRGLVRFEDRLDRLTRLDEDEPPVDLDDEKLLVTSRALRLRRDHPEWFVGAGAAYAPVPVRGDAADHVLAFARGDAAGWGAVTVATRWAGRLDADGGWGDAVLDLPGGRWRDLLTGREGAVGPDGLHLADLLDRMPVALLIPVDEVVDDADAQTPDAGHEASEGDAA